MALIKKPEGATLPASSVTEQVGETPKEEKPKRKLAKAEPEEMDRQRIIVAQNACSSVIGSQEWANLTLSLDPKERDARFEQMVRSYFNLCFKLAGE